MFLICTHSRKSWVTFDFPSTLTPLTFTEERAGKIKIVPISNFLFVTPQALTSSPVNLSVLPITNMSHSFSLTCEENVESMSRAWKGFAANSQRPLSPNITILRHFSLVRHSEEQSSYVHRYKQGEVFYLLSCPIGSEYDNCIPSRE